MFGRPKTLTQVRFDVQNWSYLTYKMELETDSNGDFKSLLLIVSKIIKLYHQ